MGGSWRTWRWAHACKLHTERPWVRSEPTLRGQWVAMKTGVGPKRSPLGHQGCLYSLHSSLKVKGGSRGQQHQSRLLNLKSKKCWSHVVESRYSTGSFCTVAKGLKLWLKCVELTLWRTHVQVSGSWFSAGSKQSDFLFFILNQTQGF